MGDILSISGLMPYLSDVGYANKIYIYESLGSTNTTLKEMAETGHGHGTVVISDSQTSGRGRYGRSFYSPSGGLYISFLLRRESLKLPEITMITALAAVMVCRAVKKVIGKESLIKWVNDILLDDKKVCGILTETVNDSIVLGIGINISAEFPDNLNKVAASISPGADASVRNRIAAELINVFLSPDTDFNNDEIYKEYKKRLTLLGKKIVVSQADTQYEAVALDIDKTYRLIIKKTDGTVEALLSGEVSVRV